MTLTIKLDRNWSSFQLANSAPPLSVTDSAIAPSARMFGHERAAVSRQRLNNSMASLLQLQKPWCNPTSLRSLASDCDNLALPQTLKTIVGTQGSLKNCISHIDASHSRQPLVKGERLVRYEVNAVMAITFAARSLAKHCANQLCVRCLARDSSQIVSKNLAIG